MEPSAIADDSPLPATPPAIPTPPAAWPRIWSNLFLILNLFSGAATVLHAAFGNTYNLVLVASVGLLLHLIATLVVITAISCYRGTPWGHLTLPLLAAIWSGHALLPLPAILSLHTVEYASGILEIAATLLCLIALRLRTPLLNTPPSFLLTTADFARFRFSLPKTLLATVAHLTLLPAAYLAALTYGSVWMVNKASAGFIHINRTGVHFQARSYRLNQQTIHLLPTVHIANPAFYKRISAPLQHLNPETTLVLPEGVTDHSNLLKNPLDYSSLASATGLTAQPHSLPQKLSPRSLHVDADINDFAPEVKDALNRFTRGMALALQQKLAEAIQDLSAMDSNVQELFWKDILENRNQRVLKGIDLAISSPPPPSESPVEHIIIPWGAAHMPGIERGLLQRNATLESQHQIELLQWKKVGAKLRHLFPTD
jgi:hypothetical protein